MNIEFKADELKWLDHKLKELGVPNAPLLAEGGFSRIYALPQDRLFRFTILTGAPYNTGQLSDKIVDHLEKTVPDIMPRIFQKGFEFNPNDRQRCMFWMVMQRLDIVPWNSWDTTTALTCQKDLLHSLYTCLKRMLDNKIIHKDVSVNNIVLLRSGKTAIIDFDDVCIGGYPTGAGSIGKYCGTSANTSAFYAPPEMYPPQEKQILKKYQTFLSSLGFDTSRIKYGAFGSSDFTKLTQGIMYSFAAIALHALTNASFDNFQLYPGLLDAGVLEILKPSLNTIPDQRPSVDTILKKIEGLKCQARASGIKPPAIHPNGAIVSEFPIEDAAELAAIVNSPPKAKPKSRTKKASPKPVVVAKPKAPSPKPIVVAKPKVPSPKPIVVAKPKAPSPKPIVVAKPKPAPVYVPEPAAIMKPETPPRVANWVYERTSPGGSTFRLDSSMLLPSLPVKAKRGTVRKASPPKQETKRMALTVDEEPMTEQEALMLAKFKRFQGQNPL